MGYFAARSTDGSRSIPRLEFPAALASLQQQPQRSNHRVRTRDDREAEEATAASAAATMNGAVTTASTNRPMVARRSYGLLPLPRPGISAILNGLPLQTAHARHGVVPSAYEVQAERLRQHLELTAADLEALLPASYSQPAPLTNGSSSMMLRQGRHLIRGQDPVTRVFRTRTVRRLQAPTTMTTTVTTTRNGQQQHKRARESSDVERRESRRRDSEDHNSEEEEDDDGDYYAASHQTSSRSRQLQAEEEDTQTVPTTRRIRDPLLGYTLHEDPTELLRQVSAYASDLQRHDEIRTDRTSPDNLLTDLPQLDTGWNPPLMVDTLNDLDLIQDAELVRREHDDFVRAEAAKTKNQTIHQTDDQMADDDEQTTKRVRCAWDCAHCQTSNPETKGTCQNCKKPRTTGNWGSLLVERLKGWKCHSCSSLNTDMKATQCASCEAKREEEGDGRPVRRRPVAFRLGAVRPPPAAFNLVELWLLRHRLLRRPQEDSPLDPLQVGPVALLRRHPHHQQRRPLD
jgi:hypothetical protein